MLTNITMEAGIVAIFKALEPDIVSFPTVGAFFIITGGIGSVCTVILKDTFKAVEFFRGECAIDVLAESAHAGIASIRVRAGHHDFTSHSTI
jgi:hypothetical protein